MTNYTFQFPNRLLDRPLDYSGTETFSLDEAQLIEIEGGGLSPPFTHRVYSPSLNTGRTVPLGSPIDWDGDGDRGTDPVQLGTNHLGDDERCDPVGEKLVGHNDWDNLRLGIVEDYFADDVRGGSTAIEPTGRTANRCPA